MNKKTGGIIGGLLVVLLLVGAMIISPYNRLVNSREDVDGMWSQVDVATQRRADLIPNLVNTVKEYTSHESETLVSITEARSRVNDASTPSEMSEANTQMNSALEKLMVVVESYPELKASEQFTQLQDELAGTENRISVERKNYNEVVTKYNKQSKRFPTVIIASVFGFDSAEYYEADDASNVAPVVDFGK